MRRLKKIVISNFKSFKEEFILDIDGNNLLMYGENGAGKSSIYWSLYTHFQACTKSIDQAQKYFKPEEKENLRNRYCDESEESFIELTFSEEGVSDYTIKDSGSMYYPADPAYQKFMEITMLSSDFLTYKGLAELFNFRNSEENEVFDMILKDYGPFIDLTEPFVSKIEGVKDSRNSQAWWLYLVNLKNRLPLTVKRKYNTHCEEYKEFEKLLKQYNIQMEKELGNIMIRTNRILEIELGIKDARLKVVYKKATFNEIVKPRTRDMNLYQPKIFIHAEMVGPKVKVREEITHPKSFFNEAKLTCMALAFRLAILSQRPPLPEASSVIIMDDLLISLDMTVRRKVIDLLLTVFANRQLLVFTHDRYFFHLLDQEISKRGSKDWIKRELYADVNSDEVPVPHLIESPSYVEQARMFLSEFRLAACANTLRRGYERELKRLLPLKLQLQVNYDNPERSQIDFNGLITGFNNLVRDGKLPPIAPSLHTDRQLILNPFSHDDIETPLYRDELFRLIEDLDKLSKVEREALIKPEDIGEKLYRIEVSNGEYRASVDFQFLEMVYKYGYEGTEYYLNPLVRTNSYIGGEKLRNKLLNRSLGINQVYAILYNSVSLKAETAPPLWTLVEEVSSSQKINDILWC